MSQNTKFQNIISYFYPYSKMTKSLIFPHSVMSISVMAFLTRRQSDPLTGAFSSQLNSNGNAIITDRHDFINNRIGSFSGGGGDCCPLVMDSLTLLAFTGFLIAATYMLRLEITMSTLMMARKRRKKRSDGKSYGYILDELFAGKIIIFYQMHRQCLT